MWSVLYKKKKKKVSMKEKRELLSRTTFWRHTFIFNILEFHSTRNLYLDSPHTPTLHPTSALEITASQPRSREAVCLVI